MLLTQQTVNEQEKPADHNENIPSNRSHIKKNQIGNCLWKQLKEVSIPISIGDKHNYEVSFMISEECKLLQLCQYFGQEALRVIENLVHSATSYQAGKERLKKIWRSELTKYIMFGRIDRFQPIRCEYAKDLEKFAYLQDIAFINLFEAGHLEELSNGTLYVRLQKKIAEEKLTQYIIIDGFTRGEKENVKILRKWVI